MNDKLDLNPDRPLLVGPETPVSPFPFALKGTVVKGYGRGSKQLGIPTGEFREKRHKCGEEPYALFLHSQLIGRSY